MPFPAILGAILPGLVADVTKRVLPPEKMGDADRAKLEHEIALALMAQDWKAVEAEISDRASARLLAEKDVAKGNAFTTILAALVRPVWGFGALILVGYSVLTGYEIAGAMQGIVETVIWFYFGGRVIEKVMPHAAGALASRRERS